MTIRMSVPRRVLDWGLAGLLVLFCIVPIKTSRAATVVQAEHVTLAAALQMPAAPGGTDWLALHFSIAPHWHLYWKNPGETGLPTQIRWTLPKGVSAGAVRWPVPERFTTGPIVNYGFARGATLLVPLTIAPGAAAGAGPVTANVSWLLCAEMCIPESATLTFGLAPPFGDASLFARAFAALPKPFNGRAQFSVGTHSITLFASGAALAGLDPAAIRFFPATRRAIDDATAPHVQIAGDSLRITFARRKHPRPFRELTGVLDLGRAGAFLVAAEPGIAAAPLPGAAARTVTAGFWTAALLALLGGLILNLMPCVLPILSMKALALAQSGERPRALRRDGLFYFAGVMASFVAMASILIALKSAGAEIGWGFQLQSPTVIAILLLLTTAIGLNLLGVFEVPLSVAGFGSHLTAGGNSASAFFTGVLAVLVASPCTAPFMGTAMGYALTQPAAIAIAVFAALGIGFAAPFTGLTFLPGVVHLIPKPGPWMVRFKELLAFPMFATAIWLLWVLDHEAGSIGLVLTLASGLGLVFFFWLLRAAAPSMRWGVGLAGLAVLAAAGFAGRSAQAPAAGSQWAPWSAQAVVAARKAGHPVLVDFGAAWCVTCLVNERIALDNAAVDRRLAQGSVVTLKGDWTTRDPAITALLTRYGRAGVPLYLLYPAQPSGQPIVLPQILSPATVLNALNRLRSRRF